MKSESFDQAHAGRCPGCGIVDHGTHIVHRYHNLDDCPHTYHKSSECQDVAYVTWRTKRTARFYAYLQNELSLSAH